MSPISQLSVLAFASTVLATPYAGHGHHNHKRFHTGPAPYPVPGSNSTSVWGSTGAPSGSSTSAPAEYTTKFETQYSTIKVNYNSGAGAGSSVSAAAVGSSAAAQCGNDVTVTTTEKVYVTVTGGQAQSSSAEVSAAGGSSSNAASTVHVTQAYTAPGSYGGSSSEAAPVSSSSAANSAPAYSAPASSSSEAAPVSSSSSAAGYSAPAYSAQSSSEAAPVSSSSAAAYSAPASSSSAADVLPTSILGSLADKGSYNTPTAYSSVAATTSSAAAATSSSSGSSGTGKRGLGYNDASLLSCFSGSSEISWAYNWLSSSDGLSGFTFIPTLHSNTDDFTSTWSANAESAISSGSTHLFSFNEPDVSSQANLSPEAAAAAHIKYMNPFAGKAKICAPSVSNGPASSNMGLGWLSEFITACAGKCQIDCYNIHWYDSATNIDYFKEQVNNATTLAKGTPVWVTEFGATGSDDQINTFLETVMPWMDSNDDVAGYAYYMASNGLLVSGTEPSTYGSTYKSYTS